MDKNVVSLAKAGATVFNVRGRRRWFPAFAGMTMAKHRIFVVYYDLMDKTLSPGTNGVWITK
jgi:hypothetical protein